MVAAWETAGAVGSVTPVETSGNFCLKSANSPSSGFCALVLWLTCNVSQCLFIGQNESTRRIPLRVQDPREVETRDYYQIDSERRMGTARPEDKYDGSVT